MVTATYNPPKPRPEDGTITLTLNAVEARELCALVGATNGTNHTFGAVWKNLCNALDGAGLQKLRLHQVAEPGRSFVIDIHKGAHFVPCL